MKHLLGAAVVLVAILCAACARPAERPAMVRVAAAADLRFGLDDLVAAFGREHPTVAVSVSYASSGVFFSQLLNRAPFDMFLSADTDYPRRLADRRLTVAGAEFIYAIGRLVLWVRAASSIDLDRLGMRALEAPGALHVAIANPDYAPYGRAAVAAMQSARVYDSVRAKLVYGENISQTLQFVQSGAADIGIVSMSLALSPEVAKAGRFWQIPVNSYPRIEQAGTILQWAANPSAAALLRAFILSDAGRRVLERHGFSFPAS